MPSAAEALPIRERKRTRRSLCLPPHTGLQRSVQSHTLHTPRECASKGSLPRRTIHAMHAPRARGSAPLCYDENPGQGAYADIPTTTSAGKRWAATSAYCMNVGYLRTHRTRQLTNVPECLPLGGSYEGDSTIASWRLRTAGGATPGDEGNALWATTTRSLATSGQPQAKTHGLITVANRRRATTNHPLPMNFDAWPPQTTASWTEKRCRPQSVCSCRTAVPPTASGLCFPKPSPPSAMVHDARNKCRSVSLVDQ